MNSLIVDSCFVDTRVFVGKTMRKENKEENIDFSMLDSYCFI